MNKFHPLLLVILSVITGCGSVERLTGEQSSSEATVIGIRATYEEGNSLARLQNFEIRRLMVVGIDNSPVDQGFFADATASVPPGRHVLTFLGEDEDGSQTISYLAIQIESGARYRLEPVRSEGELLASVVNTATGEEIGISSRQPVKRRSTEGAEGPQQPF